MPLHSHQRADGSPSLTSTIQLEPELVCEKDAARVISESWELRRRRRYADEARIARGEEPKGPVWIKDGTRVKYRVSDLRNYVANLPDIRDAFRVQTRLTQDPKTSLPTTATIENEAE